LFLATLLILINEPVPNSIKSLKMKIIECVSLFFRKKEDSCGMSIFGEQKVYHLTRNRLPTKTHLFKLAANSNLLYCKLHKFKLATLSTVYHKFIRHRNKAYRGQGSRCTHTVINLEIPPTPTSRVSIDYSGIYKGNFRKHLIVLSHTKC
jgi:hypothetical protein